MWGVLKPWRHVSLEVLSCVCLHSFYPLHCCAASASRYGLRTAFVELKPRFPLFGGWQTEFTFGYSLPLHSIVSRLADGRLRLNTDFSTPFESMVVDDLTVKVKGRVPSLMPHVWPQEKGCILTCSTA